MEFNKQQQELINSLVLQDFNEIIENPYSKQSCELDPLGVALHDYIKGCELLINSGVKTINNGNIVDLMRLALGIFAEKYPEEYYILLD